MGLSKHKIGSLISTVDERNNCGIHSFYGVNIYKEFMPTVANTNEVNEKKYKIVRKNRFVFSGMQTGRDECIRISMYMKEEPVIVSPAYTTFEVTSTDIILPEYFFMLFLSKEKDRLGWFYSDSSIRSNLDWDRFCDIEFELPSVEIQQKYVDIYLSLLENQRNYEHGLEDLKLVCDAYIENLRREMPCEKIGPYISEVNEKNNDLDIKLVQGVNSLGEFTATRANMVNIDIKKYKIVKKDQFAYNPSRINLGSIAMLKKDSCIISPMYVVFEAIDKKIIPSYLMMWFGRKEFQRSTLFYATGSVRDTFTFGDMCDVEIPIPDIKIQKDIVNIYNTYIERKEINERLKAQIRDICPILIKGSLEEAKEGTNNGKAEKL